MAEPFKIGKITQIELVQLPQGRYPPDATYPLAEKQPVSGNSEAAHGVVTFYGTASL